MKVSDLFCFSPQYSCFKEKLNQEKPNAQPKEGNEMEPTNFTQYATPYGRNADGIETFEDFVHQHGHKREIKRRKKVEKAHKNGALRRIFAALTSCKAQPKEQKPTFWIDAAPGYPERRVSGF